MFYLNGPEFRAPRLARLLLLSVGSLALMAAVRPTVAAELTYNGGPGNFDAPGAYTDPESWTTGDGSAATAAPAGDDVVDISGGTISIGDGSLAGTVNLTGGALTQDDENASLTVSDGMTISGDANVGKGVWIQAAPRDFPQTDGNPDIIVRPAITQDGADSVFDGRVSYVDDEGYLPDANFTSYTLNAGLVDVDANIVTGDLFAQTGGTMNGLANTWTYDLSHGTMGGQATVVDFALSGDGDVAGTAAGDYIHSITIDGGTIESGARFVLDPGYGPDNGLVTQTAGTMNGSIQATNYTQSGGSMGGTVTTTNVYDPSDLDDLTEGDGSMAVMTYTQSGGSLSGTVNTDLYDLTDAAAVSTSTGIINATTAFVLEPDSGTATVGAKLTGTGALTKSGAGTVVLQNASNDFTGGVAVDAGTLQVINDALPDGASVTVGQDATLQMSIDDGVTTSLSGTVTGTGGTLTKDGAGTLALTAAVTVAKLDINGGTVHVTNDAIDGTAEVDVGKDGTLQMSVGTGLTTTFGGAVTGSEGSLVKDGTGTLVLGGPVYLGALDVAGGTLDIGTGTSTDEASFESARIESGATVYVARNATLTIRVPNNIVNNGHLVNDGTVNDDLANTSTFDNNNVYNANVASNTGTINNNTPGVWTGNVLTNTGTINNNSGATWKGTVKGNSATVNNNLGGTWQGDVDANIGVVTNRSSWTGTINGNGTPGYWPIWTYGLIYNDVGATWTGDIVDNNGSIRNVTGTWNGDILDNHNDIMNDNSSGEVGIGYWNGDVVANHASIFNAGGGDWTGNVLSNNGYIKSDRTSAYSFSSGIGVAHWHGDVDGNAGTIENRGVWDGDIVGNAATIFNTGDWQGDVEAGNTGTVINAEDDYNVAPADKVRASFTGDVAGNAGTILNMGADWIGAVDANSGTITNSAGTFNTLLTGDSTWTGNVVTNAGSITNGAGSTWTGDVLANAGTITTAGIWDGSFTNSAGGTVRASGQIEGAFTNAGTLLQTGTLTGITTLTNTGVIDLRNGTTAGQTLTVDAANLEAGSTLKVGLDTAGNADSLVATTAALGGTLDVTLNPIVGNTDYTKTYTVVSGGSQTGTFSALTTDLAFLSPQLDYTTPGVVHLTLVKNGLSFADIGTTPNQKSSAAAIEALGPADPIYAAIVPLTAAEADAAFDQLSGASQSTMQTADFTAANLITNVLAGRIDQSFDALGSGGDGVSNYAEGPGIVASPTPTTGVWGQFYGAHGMVASTTTAAGVNSTTGGFASGIDGQLGHWRLGAMVQAGSTASEVPDDNASSTSVDYGAGLYGGGKFANTRLAFGAGYTRHDVNASRHVTFPGFDETLSANYAMATAQAFGQLSQQFDVGPIALTPYMNGTYVANMTDGYTESGGAAAITAAPSVAQASFATLGLNAMEKFAIGNGMLLTADAGVGWRRTFADTPSAEHSLAGGTSFTVLGAPLPTDTAIVDAGVNLDLSATNTVNLSYNGQFAPGTEAHGLKAAWNGRF